MDALLPLTLTAVHGYSPTAAGIPLTAGAIGWCVASNLQGRLPDAAAASGCSGRASCCSRVGLAGTALAALPAVGGWPAYPFWAVAGLGMGLGMPSVGVLLLDQSPGAPARRGLRGPADRRRDRVGAVHRPGRRARRRGDRRAAVPAAAILASVAVFTVLALVGVAVAGRAAAPAAGDSLAAATTLATP